MAIPKDTVKVSDSELVQRAEATINQYDESIARCDDTIEQQKRLYQQHTKEKFDELTRLGLPEDAILRLEEHFDVETVVNSPRALGSPRKSPKVSPTSSPKSGSITETTHDFLVENVPGFGTASKAFFGDPNGKAQKAVDEILEGLEEVSLEFADQVQKVESRKEDLTEKQAIFAVLAGKFSRDHNSKTSVIIQHKIEEIQEAITNAANDTRETMNYLAEVGKNNIIYAKDEMGRMAHETGEYLDRKGKEAYKKAKEDIEYLRTEGPRIVKENLTHAGENIKQGALYAKDKAVEGYEYAKKHQAGDAALRMGAGASIAVIGGTTGLVLGGAAVSMAALVAGVSKYGGKLASGILWGTARTCLAVANGIEDMVHKAGQGMKDSIAAMWHKPKAIMNKMKVGHFQTLLDKSFEVATKDMPKVEKEFLKASYDLLKKEDVKYAKAIANGDDYKAIGGKIDQLQAAVWDKIPDGKHKDDMIKYSNEIIDRYDTCIKEYEAFRSEVSTNKSFHDLDKADRDKSRAEINREVDRRFTKVDEMFAVPANALIMAAPEAIEQLKLAGKSVGHLLQGESAYRETRINEHAAIGGRDSKIQREIDEAAKELSRATEAANKYGREAKKGEMVSDVAGAMETFAKAGVTRADDHNKKVQNLTTKDAPQVAKALGDVELSNAKKVEKQVTGSNKEGKVDEIRR